MLDGSVIRREFVCAGPARCPCPPHNFELTFPLGSQASSKPTYGSTASDWHETPSQPERPSCQNIRHALVNGQETLGFCFAGWETHHLGCLYHKQSARNSPSIILGHDLRLRSQRKLCRVRRSRQYMLNLQSFVAGWPNPCRKGALWPHRLPVLLPICQRPKNHHLVWRYDMHDVGH